MASIDKLRYEVATTKKNIISDMSPKDMEPYIWNLLTDYYYSYINNDMDKFHAVDEEVADALEILDKGCINSTDYINYCRISIMTTLLNKLFKRDAALEMPQPVSIAESGHTIDESVWDELYPLLMNMEENR